MRVLVTGGAGFIGSNLTRFLLAAEHDVTVIDDFSTGYKQNLAGLPVTLVEGSVTDPLAVRAAIQGQDAVVHLAALGSVPRSIKDPVLSHQVNVNGTLVVLEEARHGGTRQVIFASSSSVYGANPTLPKRERHWVRPKSPYAASKLAAEQYCLAYGDSYGLDVLAFRFFNVYGPRQAAGHAYAAVIPVFMDAILRGQPLYINGDGTHSRDFTYVDTVCRALVQAVELRTKHPGPVNLAFGTSTTLTELVAAIEDVTDREAYVIHRDPRPGDVKHSRADNAVLTQLFPELRSTPLTDGLRATHAWMIDALGMSGKAP